MQLPDEEYLSINKLATVFNHTTNSYKFYWFLAILNLIKKYRSRVFDIEKLIIEMIAEIWYPINYFNLSFGKQDQFSKAISNLVIQRKIPVNIKKNELILLLETGKNDEDIKQIIRGLSRYVPYRFISSWYSNELRGVIDSNKNQIISELSVENYINVRRSSVYKVDSTKIEINFYWYEYLFSHLSILESFTYWNLIKYLQKNNPNVPGISEKLFAPQTRNLTLAKEFWDVFLNQNEGFHCIYSNQLVVGTEYSIDHFIPWSFIAHDQLWNLIPTNKSVNSSKGNYFPSTKYLENFIKIQFEAVNIYSEKKPESLKSLLDYSMLFKLEHKYIPSLSLENFSLVLKNNIYPSFQIGKNMGYKDDWKYF